MISFIYTAHKTITHIQYFGIGISVLQEKKYLNHALAAFSYNKMLPFC